LINCRDRERLRALAGSDAALVAGLAELAAAGIGFPEGDASIELVPLVLAGLSPDEVMVRLAAIG